MKFYLALVFTMALPSFASAQAHYCDSPPPTVTTKSPPTAFRACWNQKEEDGVTAAVATSIDWLVDGVVVKTSTNPQPAGAANAAGLFEYRTTGVAIPKGARVLTAVVKTADGSADPSVAYNFSVVGGKPSKLVGAGVEPR